MKTFSVDLDERSYPIYVGSCFQSPELFSNAIPHSEVLIVTNETVAPLYLETLATMLGKEGRRLESVVLPDGEQYKTLETVNQIFTHLLEHNFSRKVALVALGGGVVGDMTGFAAASYQRGVDFYQIPTTLLSQVDSSVGGKTGVNHPLGKNMIGAFKQPKAVFIDPATLSTLPSNEFSAGFAEVIKHAVIQSIDYLDYLETHLDDIFALKEDVLIEVIAKSCEIKSRVVSLDETEQGIRAILNLGHTFGHAIETTMGYGQWLHGEAVATGIVMAAVMSEKLGYIQAADVDRIRHLIERSNLPVTAPDSMTLEQFQVAMLRDKKVDAGTLRLVLIRAIGDAFVTADFSKETLVDTLKEFTA